MTPEAILFDLDGTLVDSAIDLSIAINITFTELNLPLRSEKQVRGWIGNGIDKLLHRALTNSFDGIATDKQFSTAKPVFYSAYENQNGKKSRLYPDVLSVLRSFSEKNIFMGCITNKSRCFTLPLLERLGIRQFFGVVVAGDDLTHKKPHPEPLIFAAKKLNTRIARCLMIGDSKSDVTAANAAGMGIICVDYGYAQGENLQEMQIEALISNFKAIENNFDDID